VSSRRLSQAIAEGDGISLLVEVAHAAEAAPAGATRAEGLVVRAGGRAAGSALPVLAYGPSPDDAAALGADAVVLSGAADDDELHELARRALELGLEPVVHVRDEDDLERVLEELDPEILLLGAEGEDDDETPLERLLDLLPDVPAGKLAIADLASASREDVEELERAGVDAVLVAGDVDGLVGDAPPEV
jgi:hypothetical protein